MRRSLRAAALEQKHQEQAERAAALAAELEQARHKADTAAELGQQLAKLQADMQVREVLDAQINKELELTRAELRLLSDQGPLTPFTQVAEDAATVDVISGGRFELGVALGYNLEENVSFGVPLNERGQRVSEELAIIRGLLLRSDMLAAVSAHQLEAEIASGELCILPLELRHTSRAIGLTSRTASLHSPVAKALMDVIRQVIQEQTQPV